MIKPLGDRIVLTVDQPKEEKVGGVLIANNAKEKPITGSVVAISQTSVGDSKAPKAVKVGDKVMFDKYSGSNVTIDGDDYLIIHEKDILGVL